METVLFDEGAEGEIVSRVGVATRLIYPEGGAVRWEGHPAWPETAKRDTYDSNQELNI